MRTSKEAGKVEFNISTEVARDIEKADPGLFGYVKVSKQTEEMSTVTVNIKKAAKAQGKDRLDRFALSSQEYIIRSDAGWLDDSFNSNWGLLKLMSHFGADSPSVVSVETIVGDAQLDEKGASLVPAARRPQTIWWQDPLFIRVRNPLEEAQQIQVALPNGTLKTFEVPAGDSVLQVLEFGEARRVSPGRGQITVTFADGYSVDVGEININARSLLTERRFVL